ncbi:MAG: hypothetical protein AAGM22_09595 [Acidobacteriota bacterium]
MIRSLLTTLAPASLILLATCCAGADTAAGAAAFGETGESSGQEGAPPPTRRPLPTGQSPESAPNRSEVPLPNFLKGKIPGTETSRAGADGRAQRLNADENREHFRRVLDLSVTAGLEVAERYRLSLSRDLSLVTRIRSHGARPTDTRRGLGVAQNPPQPPPELPSAVVEVIGQIRAVTEQLDGLGTGDPRVRTLLDRREVLHQKRRDLLNRAWASVNSVDIPTYHFDLQPRLAPDALMLYYLVEADQVDMFVVPAEGEVLYRKLEVTREALDRDVKEVIAGGQRPARRGVGIVEDAESGAESRRCEPSILQF